MYTICSFNFSVLLIFQGPCSSSPCQNGGICVVNHKFETFECLCESGFVGEFCEKGIVDVIYNFEN